jgi:hypothetical protein
MAQRRAADGPLPNTKMPPGPEDAGGLDAPGYFNPELGAVWASSVGGVGGDPRLPRELKFAIPCFVKQ